MHSIDALVELLGFGDATEARLCAMSEDVLQRDVLDDGVSFDAGSLDVGPIREDQEYGGIRITLTAKVTSAHLRPSGRRWIR